MLDIIYFGTRRRGIVSYSWWSVDGSGSNQAPLSPWRTVALHCPRSSGSHDRISVYPQTTLSTDEVPDELHLVMSS